MTIGGGSDKLRGMETLDTLRLHGAPDLVDYTKRKTSAVALDWGNVTLFYSYQTPVALWRSGFGLVVRENDWGPTTAKHMREARTYCGGSWETVSGAAFDQLLAETFH